MRMAIIIGAYESRRLSLFTNVYICWCNNVSSCQARFVHRFVPPCAHNAKSYFLHRDAIVCDGTERAEVVPILRLAKSFSPRTDALPRKCVRCKYRGSTIGSTQSLGWHGCTVVCVDRFDAKTLRTLLGLSRSVKKKNLNICILI